MRSREATLPVEVELKEKYLKKFQDEMNNHRQLKEYEKQAKIQEERDYISRVQREIELDKIQKQSEKHQIKSFQLNEYHAFLEKKRLEERKRFEEKLNEKKNTSLNMNSEQNINQYKQYIGKLDENTEKNMEYHKRYLNENLPKEAYNPQKIEEKQMPTQNTKYSDQDTFKNDKDNETMNKDYNYNTNKLGSEIKQTTQENGIFVENSPKDFLSSSRRPEEDLKLVDFNELNAKNYKEYQSVKKDCLNFNQYLVNNKLRTNEMIREEKKKIAEERIREAEKAYSYEMEMKRIKQDQQKIYKSMLDGQFQEKYLSPNITNKHLISRENKFVDDHSFIFKNQSFSVAPYTEKKYEIGKTFLSHNPIVNPVPDYRNNKYLYRESPNNSLRLVGNNIIG